MFILQDLSRDFILFSLHIFIYVKNILIPILYRYANYQAKLYEGSVEMYLEKSNFVCFTVRKLLGKVFYMVGSLLVSLSKKS